MLIAILSKDRVLREVIPSLLFYLSFALAVYLFDKAVPSGPCTPGGIVLLFILPFISAALLLKGIYQKKRLRILIHALVIVAFLVMIGIASS